MGINDFEKLYTLYANELKYFIYTTAMHDMHAAEDILQNTMIKAYKYNHTLNNESKLGPWLRKIAYNETMNYYNSIGGANFQQLYENVEDVYDKYQQTVEPDFSIELLSSYEFQRLLKNLTATEQSILVLYYVYGYNLTEISKLLDANKNTIKSIHRRAIAKLTKYFSKEQVI